MAAWNRQKSGGNLQLCATGEAQKPVVEAGSGAVGKDAEVEHTIHNAAGIQLGFGRQELKALSRGLDVVSLNFRGVVTDVDVHRAAGGGVDGDNGGLDEQIRGGAEMQPDGVGQVHRCGPEQLQTRAAEGHAIRLDG